MADKKKISYDAELKRANASKFRGLLAAGKIRDANDEVWHTPIKWFGRSPTAEEKRQYISNQGWREERGNTEADKQDIESESEALRRQVLKSFKHGGVVKKTGIYKLHRGERVLSRTQAKSVPLSSLRHAR